MKYSENDMAALIGEVEAQFTEHLEKAEQEQTNKLEKSETEETVENTEASVQKSEQNDDESLDYDENDYAEMDTLYTSMSKSEAEAHYKSVKKAVFGESDSEKLSENTVEKVEDKQVTKAEEDIKTDDKLAKGEEQADPKTSETKEDKLSKSEEDLRQENEDLKKSLSALTGALAKFVKVGDKAPKQKAITTKIEYIKKSEAEDTKEKAPKEDVTKLDQKEIGTRLSNKIKSGSLTKAEREKINNFYNGSVSITEIKDLL